VASVVPQSLDHLDELVSGPDGSLVDLEIIQQYGRKDSVTLHFLRAGTPAAQPLLPFEAESDEAGIGVQVEAVEGGNRAAVSVAKIEEGSPAYWSDLRVGDVITHVHSMAIETAGAFRSHGHGVVGTRLVLAVERGETFSLRVVLIRARTLRQAALACAKAYKNKVLQLLHDRLQGSQRLAHMHTTDAEARESPIHEKNANLDLERMQVSECTQWEMGTPAFHGLKGWLTTGRRLPAASGGESCRSFSGLAEVWHTLSRPDSDWEGAFVSQSPMASLPCCIRGVLW
jgi:hypothetical protein